MPGISVQKAIAQHILHKIEVLIYSCSLRHNIYARDQFICVVIFLNLGKIFIPYAGGYMLSKSLYILTKSRKYEKKIC